jgi:hypothetical protein
LAGVAAEDEEFGEAVADEFFEYVFGNGVEGFELY